MSRSIWPLVIILALASCRSARTRNLELVADRTMKLRPRARWAPTWCRVDSELSGPARARFAAIFPADQKSLAEPALPYTWKATGASCEVTPLDRSPLAENERAFLDVAFCLLVQTHLVNSPFAGLTPVAVESRGDQTFVRTGAEPDLGLALDRARFEITTTTRAHGVIDARYAEVGGVWLPLSLSHRGSGGVIVLDQFEYDPAVARPRSFALAAGATEATAHARVIISDCQNY